MFTKNPDTAFAVKVSPEYMDDEPKCIWAVGNQDIGKPGMGGFARPAHDPVDIDQLINALAVIKAEHITHIRAAWVKAMICPTAGA